MEVILQKTTLGFLHYKSFQKGNGHTMLQTEKELRGAFWASYLNAAANNVRTVIRYASGERDVNELRNDQLSYIEDKKNKKGDELDDKTLVLQSAALSLLECQSEANLSKQIDTMKKIAKAIPFMGYVWRRIETGVKKNGFVKTPPEEMTPQKFAKILSNYINYLFQLRNYFTHYQHDFQAKEPLEPCYLGIVFDAVVVKTKERFYPEDCLSKDDKKFNNFRKFKGVEKVIKEGNEVKQPKRNPDYKFYFWEKDSNADMTIQGLAFFTSLFLEKKYANMMLDFIGIDKGQTNMLELFGFEDLPMASREDKLTLIKRIYTIACARLPRTRIESENLMSTQVLGLDILSCLHKCPSQLYSLLSPQDQQQFHTVSDATGQEMELKRFDDRFPYLTLNYLDRIANYSSLRFCIDMGNYYFRCHSRTLIDGSRIEDRRLKKRITCFDKIQNAITYYQQERDKEGSLYFKGSEFKTPPETYRQDMMPRYAIKDNRIGIALCSLGGDRALFKQIPLPPNRKDGKDKPQTYAPDAWLSLYELMPILFLSTHDQEKVVEQTLKTHIDKWHKFISRLAQLDASEMKAMRWNSGKQTRDDFSIQFKEKYGLELMDIPEEIRYYLLNGKIKAAYSESESPDRSKPLELEDAAEKWLRKKCDDNRALISRFKQDSEYEYKLGKSRRARFTNGYIAQWLVRDFMRFQKSNGSAEDKFGKIKSSPDYMALQAALTCFKENSGSIKDLFIKARLIDGANYDHPFLARVFKSGHFSSVKQFFKTYLDKRLEWLRNVGWNEVYQLRRLYQRGENKTQINNTEDAALNYIRRFAEKIAREPVCLPRGLFDQAVRETLRNLYPDKFAAEIPAGQRANFTFLMQKYLNWSGDAPQWFYQQLKAWTGAKEFNPLFELMGSAQLRYDAAGMKLLNEKLDETRNRRRRDIQNTLFRDNDFKRLSPKEKEEQLQARMERDEARFTRSLNRLRDTWKEIRMVSVQDVLLRDTIWRLLALPEKEVRLRDIKPESENQQLKKQRQENPQDVIEGKLANDSLLNRTVDLAQKIPLPHNEGDITLTGKMKRKNFGNFFRMLSDPRLLSFLRLYKQFGIESVNYDFLELKEFEQYDRIYRPKMFKLVYKLEEKVLNKYPELYDSSKGYADFWGIAGKASQGNEFTQILLVMFRNAFAHQYYPEFKPGNDWTPEEKETFPVLWANELNTIKSSFLRAQAVFGKTANPPVLVQDIYDYAERLFNDVIQRLG